MLPGSLDLSRRAVPSAASRRGRRPRRYQHVLLYHGVGTGGSPAVGDCCRSVWSRSVHHKHRGHADAPDVDLHVSERKHTMYYSLAQRVSEGGESPSLAFARRLPPFHTQSR